eukprot:CAMPEP_0177672544 /NCGR_PEP_ID=MMETSP0447-20121125/25405_1 /TAXON_ID=0 /ORGANISM="Stygamoeba regulata, Strain BSH-02190019" /LENGTH=51 /DNA_ID=CAMNT_0019180233 /DNA_START=237 /DNA_END=393 /DNA_ORIENTATION=+
MNADVDTCARRPILACDTAMTEGIFVATCVSSDCSAKPKKVNKPDHVSTTM